MEDTNITIQFPKEEKGKFVLSKGLNWALLIFHEDKWEEFGQWMSGEIPLTSKEGRCFARFFKASAIDIKVEDNEEVISIPRTYWDYLTQGKENVTSKIYTVKDYLNIRKESIGELEKKVLKFASFVVVA